MKLIISVMYQKHGTINLKNKPVDSLTYRQHNNSKFLLNNSSIVKKSFILILADNYTYCRRKKSLGRN